MAFRAPIWCAAAAALALAAWAPRTQVQPGATEPADAPPPPAANHAIIVGDAAPGLPGLTWIGGEPVTAFEPGRMYAVCFWTAWSAPGVRSLAEISSMQKRFAALKLTAVAISTTDAVNSAADVKSAVIESGSAVTCAVATDEGAAWTAYMRAAEQEAVPTVFVIDPRGTLASVGTVADAERTLSEISQGMFDAAAARSASQKRLSTLLRARPLEAAYRRSFRERNWDDASRYATQLVQLDAQLFGFYAVRRAGITLYEQRDPLGALMYLQSAVGSTIRDNPAALAGAAELIVRSGDLATRGQELALTAARRAADLTGNTDPAMLSTLALVYEERGDEGRAAALLTKAIDAEPQPAAREALRDRLNQLK